MYLKSIKIVLSFLFLIQSFAAASQEDKYRLQRQAVVEKINQKQNLIDAWDGKMDGLITFKDPVQTAQATRAYLAMVDSSLHYLEVEGRDALERYRDVLHLYKALDNVSSSNYHLTEYQERLFENMLSVLKHKNDSDLPLYLLRNMQASLSNLSLYIDTEHAEPFLRKVVRLYPNEVLRELSVYGKKAYALSILEEVAHVSPQTLKKYFPGKNMVNSLLLESKDPVVNLLIELYRKYGAESKVYYFADLILKEGQSADLLHSISQYPRTYLNALITVQQRENPIGALDIERELSIKALEEVRKVNDLHDLTDSTKRFAAVRDMGALELYTLIVYSPEEIFTSTFNGIFERLLFHMKNEGLNGYYLIDMANYNRFRTFIKLCAGYNALSKFLATMETEEAEALLKMFVTSLNSDDGNLSEAVNVADTFGSLDDPTYLKIFEGYLKEEFYQAETNRDTKTLYGLLLKLLYKKLGNPSDSALALQLQEYPLPPVDGLSVSSISGTAHHTQMHFFFDDEDGLTSFSTFIASFKAAGFAVEETRHYVKISGKGKTNILIYANKPLSEREGQAELIDMVQKGEIVPTVIVHRGHSYYAMNTISNIPPFAKIVFLGSCGGYHNITEVIKRAPDVHIIASKQIGTYVVNNTLLVEMSKTIQNSDQLTWAQLWKQLDGKLKGTGKGYERFLDYVPPHKNMGAIFIQAYNRLAERDSF
jgi:uncharacterized protein YejL (UPF0352 family)